MDAGSLLSLHASTQGADDQIYTEKIEVVSVTEEDIPAMDPPALLKVSPLDSSSASPSPDDSTVKPTFEVTSKDPLTETPSAQPSLSMPVTKVQPFVTGTDVHHSLWSNHQNVDYLLPDIDLYYFKPSSFKTYGLYSLQLHS